MELRTPEQLATLLEVLRDAGVETFALGDLAVRFAPVAPPVGKDREPDAPPPPAWWDVKFPGEETKQ